MLVLDTNILTILEWSVSSPRAQRLLRRLETSEEHTVTTIICCEEQMRGWMASLNAKRQLKEQIEAYRRLRVRIEKYAKMIILDFDEPAAVQLQQLKKMKLHIGTMDLKIASIALVHGATVLTENVRDFKRVPGLRVEDWQRI